jgi:hypothetical protein
MPQYMVLLYDTPESVEQWKRMSAEQRIEVRQTEPLVEPTADTTAAW